jgi:hypothetical protein
LYGTDLCRVPGAVCSGKATQGINNVTVKSKLFNNAIGFSRTAERGEGVLRYGSRVICGSWTDKTIINYSAYSTGHVAIYIFVRIEFGNESVINIIAKLS